MKKKITLITSILLILALAVTFVGCNKDKTEETPTTEASKVSTTEPTTKFEAPEIKDEPTTEETTEETEASAPETTTKKSTYSSNSSGSSGSSSGNSGSSSKPASTTKASSSNNVPVTDSAGNTALVTNSSGGGVFISSDWGQNTGGHGDASVYETDPDVLEAEGAHNFH